MTDPYATLEVPPSADAAQIKRAYRKKAAKAHPDRKGGDKESFQLVQRAYDILSDPARRQHWDQSGADSGQQQDSQANCLSLLAGLVLDAVNKCNDLDHNNIKKIVENAIRTGQQRALESISQMQNRIKRYQTAIKRFKSKAGPGYITKMLEAEAAKQQFSIEQAEEQIALGEEMLGMLKDYEYEVEPMPTPGIYQTVGIWTTTGR